MGTLPDFNFGTWLQRFDQGFEADLIGNFGYGNIQPVIIPYTFAEQYIRILLTANYKKDTWKQGAKLYQTIPTFLGNSDVIDERVIALGKPEILDLTQYPDGSKLRLEFFPWFRDINILIHAWQN